ncbi:MAG TPA: hypothetical protein P5107_00415 [Thermotogota bacterium]|nr:hypothetical protein [Thermotogota bacterium]
MYLELITALSKLKYPMKVSERNIKIMNMEKTVNLFFVNITAPVKKDGH